MSRICVKNLPAHIAEARLKDHFSQKGEITDVKLVRTTCGKSRRIAFIGFRTQDEAQAALKYFNNSYIGSSKITCEVALPIGDPNIPMPWSRHSKKKREELNKDKKNSSDAKRLAPPRPKEEIKKRMDFSDPVFREYLQVTQPRSQSKVWGNDTVEILLKNKKENDANAAHSTKGSHNLHPQAQAESGDLFENLNSGVNKVENLSQMPNNKYELVRESGRLFVHNLPFTSTEDDLTELFQRFGNLSEVHLVLEKDTKMPKGCAYVRYTLPESAIRALDKLDESNFQGRFLRVMPAEEPNSSGKPLTITASQYSKTFKKQKAERRKSEEASGDTRAWNSFYMRPDTVVEYIARKLGVSKIDILDPVGNNLAVQVALCEAQIISDTKKALVNSGVNVTALEKLCSGKDDGISKSNHVILVKNLPYCTSEGDLATMFGKYGSIDKIILPPTKALALVVFLEAAECKAAFKGLAYTCYEGFPLYLQEPPCDILSFTTKLEDDSKDDDDVKGVISEQNQLTKVLYDEDIDPGTFESTTLYVKNLNFRTSDECLRAHVSVNLKEGSIRSAKVVRDRESGKSRGHGFIEFDSVQTATNMCQSLQGSVLDGRALEMEMSLPKNDELGNKAKRTKSSTKLCVQNLAFEATKSDLKLLFSPFGQIKRVSVPRRPGLHKGFAFVEFCTKQEVQNALMALTHAHLYGRHMVLEFAKEDMSLEEMQAHTAAHYVDELNGFQTQSRKRKTLALSHTAQVRVRKQVPEPE